MMRKLAKRDRQLGKDAGKKSKRGYDFRHNPLNLLVGGKGFEPSTSTV
jgi:hypothetical protein